MHSKMYYHESLVHSVMINIPVPQSEIAVSFTV